MFYEFAENCYGRWTRNRMWSIIQAQPRPCVSVCVGHCRKVNFPQILLGFCGGGEERRVQLVNFLFAFESFIKINSRSLAKLTTREEVYQQFSELSSLSLLIQRSGRQLKVVAKKFSALISHIKDPLRRLTSCIRDSIDFSLLPVNCEVFFCCCCVFLPKLIAIILSGVEWNFSSSFFSLVSHL